MTDKNHKKKPSGSEEYSLQNEKWISINSRLEQAIERICECEDRIFEIIHLKKFQKSEKA